MVKIFRIKILCFRHFINRCLIGLSKKIYLTYTVICLSQGSLNCELPPKQKTDICTIMYTSGTTGEPKGVILTNEAMMAEVLCIDLLLLLTDKVVRNQTQIMLVIDYNQQILYHQIVVKQWK